uniref:Multiple C2 and transmembrane domain containing 1 n=1 Tax=Paramormyrops kingsleyae TaxID=1676925 RepID=A0A3B3SMM2_9TELE
MSWAPCYTGNSASSSTEAGLAVFSPGRNLTGITIVEPRDADPPPSNPGMYQLDVLLKMGHNLAIRDRGGTSDPYVKLKIAGKEVFRSKTIHKNLNPVWDEKVSLLVDSLSEPLYFKVFDYDFGLQDDFMGSAYLYLESLELKRTHDVKLELKDAHCPDEDLGSLELAVTLTPKEMDSKDSKMLLRRSWKRTSKVMHSMHPLDEEWPYALHQSRLKQTSLLDECQLHLFFMYPFFCLTSVCYVESDK